MSAVSYVMVRGEQERDVHGNAFHEQLLGSFQPGGSAGYLDHHVWSSCSRMETSARVDSPGRIIYESRTHLE